MDNVSLFLKPVPSVASHENLTSQIFNDPMTRPKSSSLKNNTPIKSNSQTYLATPDKGGNYFSPQQQSPLNYISPHQKIAPQIPFNIPKFPTPNRNSPSPNSRNSLDSPKKFSGGLLIDPVHVQNNEENSPQSPMGGFQELPSFEEMKGNILNIAKSQSGSR